MLPGSALPLSVSNKKIVFLTDIIIPNNCSYVKQIFKIVIDIFIKMVYTKYIQIDGGIFMTITTIQKWGNSQGIRIPKFLLDTVQWNDDEKLVLIAEKGKIIIEKAELKKSIVELFDGFDDEYKPIEIDWGKAEGEEIW